MQLVKFELYKLLKQRMIWIGFVILLGFFGFTSYMSVENGMGLAEEYSFYKGNEGKIDLEKASESNKEVDRILNENNHGFSQEELQRMSYLSDLWSTGEKLNSYNKEKASLEKKVSELEGKSEDFEYRKAKYKLQVLEKVGEPQFFYTRAWTRVTGFSEGEGPLVLAILILIGISSIFSKEHSTGMYQFILSSKEGRKRIVTAKVLASYIYVALFTTFFFILSLIYSVIFWGSYGFNVTLRQLPFFQDTFLTIKVWQYLFLEYGIFLIGALALATLVMFISSVSKNSMAGIFIGGGIVYLPLVLRSLPQSNMPFIEMLSDFSYIGLMGVKNLFSTLKLYNLFGQPVPMLYIILPLFIGLSVLFVYITYVSIRRKEIA